MLHACLTSLSIKIDALFKLVKYILRMDVLNVIKDIHIKMENASIRVVLKLSTKFVSNAEKN